MADTVDIRGQIRRCPDCGAQYGLSATFCPFDGQPLVTERWEPVVDTLMGTLVDQRYEVVAAIGEGGMGTVYKVRHAALGRPFAMKVLRRDLASDDKLAARFIQEAKATAAVKHPNVVAITDFGRLPDGRPYFVMELCNGQTLSQALKTEGPLDPGRAARIGVKVARALAAAHEAGVIHRDLKPENVFLIAAASGEVDVRVVDFGAALIVGGGRMTKTGVVFGTPHYMSPEQASGQAIDHRADIYALGIILYEMLTGKVPFEADTFMGVLSKHMFVTAAPPSDALGKPGALGALDEVALHAIEKHPDRRYLTMEALARDLDASVRAASDGSIEIAASLGDVRGSAGASDGSSIDVPMRPAWPFDVSPWALLAVFLVAASVTVFATRSLQRAPQGPAPAGSSVAASAPGAPVPATPASAGPIAPNGSPPAVASAVASPIPPAAQPGAAAQPAATPASTDDPNGARSGQVPAPAVHPGARGGSAGPAPSSGAAPPRKPSSGADEFRDPWGKK